MSKDIRSFFKVLSKKPNQPPATTTVSKKRIILDSSDEDVIPETPPLVKSKPIKHKKRKLVDSDSESDSKKKPKQPALKPVNVSDVFSSTPVKQTKVQVKVKSSTDEAAFEKTLQQLDEDFPFDVDDLDKTIDEAVKNGSPKKERPEESQTPKKSPGKRRHVEEHIDSGMDPDQERYEKRRHSYAMYQKYLNRSGPVHKGAKELPKGKPDCLKGLCFLKTGVLDSMDKVDVDALVKDHGGRTVIAVSRKVNYLVVGEDPGPAKIEKARSMGIKEISEDELLDMILVKSGLPPKYVKQAKGEEVEVRQEKSPEKVKAKEEKVILKDELKKKDHKKATTLIVKEEKKSPRKEETRTSSKTQAKPNLKSLGDKMQTQHSKIVHSEDLKPIERIPVQISDSSKTWTEKYKPLNVKGIIGQQGDKSNMNKLMSWLRNWHKNHSGKDKPKLTKPSPWAKDDSGAYFKCALLSGSPGVGKTTTATLVAKELGFDVVEFNASDTRSKKLLHEEVSQLLSSKSIASYFKDGSAPTMKHVLLMDEVDGMAGNEDRGGIQELIALIKNSEVPIICMCNDRQHQKMRSLVNYCYDLRFTKPRPEQIKGAMMSICHKEGLKISGDALTNIIKAAGMDIRQTLNNLFIWSAGDKNLTQDMVQKESSASKKDTVLGPWEVIRKVFSEEEHKGMTVGDKSRLFFYDYSIGPLFVQENYLQVVPHCSKGEILERVSAAADSISMGDVIDKKIRSTNNWSLLESQAMYSSVLPGFYMEGHMGGQINFPGWLGKNSKRGKFQRLLSELQAHMRTNISGSKSAVNLDYIYHLRNNIVTPLAKNGTAGVAKSLEVMKAYSLLREDFDSILELSQWPRQKDPMAMVESKVKAAFTRMYNKEGPALPYSISTMSVKKRTVASQDDIYGEEEGDEEEEDDDDISKDAMIKEKKKPVTKGKKDPDASTSKKAASGRGRGKKLK